MKNEMAFSTYSDVIAFELRAALRRYHDTWESVLCQSEVSRPLEALTVEQSRISVIVLNCALLESAINFYLCTKCDARRFKTLDGESLFNKWARVPREFVSTYTFSDDLSEDLHKLIQRRRAIVHAKPMMSIDGDNRHQGNEPPIELDEHEFIGRCASLAYRLVENVLSFDSDACVHLLHIHTQCGVVWMQFKNAQPIISAYSTVSERLVAEIMSQGYDRKTALQCAVRLRGTTTWDRDGNMLVRKGGHLLARLKPLEYFAKRSTAAASEAKPNDG